MRKQNSAPRSREHTPVVQSYLSKTIKNLKWLIAAFSFTEGFVDAKSVVFYLIYNNIYHVPLFTYSVASSFFMLAVIMRMVYSITSDNVSIFGSRRKSYLFIINWIEVILYVSVVLIIQSQGSFYIIFIVHFALKVTNTWRHSVLRKLNSWIDSIPERIEQQPA